MAKTSVPKRFLLAIATVPNNSQEGESIPVVFFENPPRGSGEMPRVVGYTNAFIQIPKFDKFEFEGNRIAPRKNAYILKRNR